ncbi:uncharacterized protein LOC110739794 [Chenopodium quinoa]|uniref:uncharacterized protein LOC110739789 n=1 Tax=Chenopodium quinoa TaxID=63459 RepID=UPI000B78EC10|nr:uncharacterized protein LOC110739789 [Chenopodium quinoa]XP_021775969.1 uncharacterized protein LOC110739794 [Chenopodium quinoa]
MYLRSPFMVEHEKLFKNVDNRKVAEYAFAQGDNKELLYADNMGTTITRDEIHSLIEDKHMLNNVVDAYVCLLNFENKRRGVDKKSRFFFSTECYLICCTEKYFKSNERQDDRMKALFDRMQQEMTTTGVTSFKSIQLVFFPVVLPDHYYLLCVNFVEGTFDLIDNIFLPPNIPFHNKYGNYHRLMLNAFADFVHSIDSNIKSDFVSSFKTRNLSMSWKSNKNKHDCGVFLLKHMETYEGESVKQWNSGLELDNFDQMKKLRVEYCGKIITAEVNEERNKVIRRSKKWSKENKMDI